MAERIGTIQTRCPNCPGTVGGCPLEALEAATLKPARILDKFLAAGEVFFRSDDVVCNILTGIPEEDRGILIINS